MSAWWNGLTGFEQTFFCIAFPASAILLIQTILTFIGLGDDGGADGVLDAEGDAGIEIDGADSDPDDMDLDGTAGFRFFSIRGAVAFFTLFGWIGALLGAGPMNRALVILIAAASGLLAMLLIALIFYGVSRLQSSGNIRYANALGQTAEVYLTIPPARKGMGKVQIILQERLVEVNAMTDTGSAIPTGSAVKVTGILQAHVLLVEPLI